MAFGAEFIEAYQEQRKVGKAKPIGGVDTGNPTRDAEILASDLQALAQRREPGLEIRRRNAAAAQGLTPPEVKPR